MTAYDPSNVFAKILRGELPSHTVYEDTDTLAIMDIMPRADGHVLVVPKAPCRNVFDAPAEALNAVALTTQKLARAVKAAFSAEGVTIQQFNEAAGGQVVFHLHVHVMPRFEGVALRPHTGAMEKNEVLASNAEKIREALKKSDGPCHSEAFCLVLSSSTDGDNHEPTPQRLPDRA